MRAIIVRSLVIGLVVGVLAQCAVDLLFARAVVPSPSYDADRARSMSGPEAVAYLDANMTRLSGVSFLVYSFREPTLLADKAMTFGFLSAMVSLGCILFGLWAKTSAG